MLWSVDRNSIVFENFHICVSVGIFEFSVLKSCIIYMLPRPILYFSLLYSFGALRTQCWTLNGHAGIIPHHSCHCVFGVSCSEHFASRHCCFERRSCAASLTAHTFSCCTTCGAKAPCLESAAAVLRVKGWSLYRM